MYNDTYSLFYLFILCTHPYNLHVLNIYSGNSLVEGHMDGALFPYSAGPWLVLTSSIL